MDRKVLVELAQLPRPLACPRNAGRALASLVAGVMAASVAVPAARADIAASLPDVIQGSPSGSLLRGRFPLYAPVRPFQNSAGTRMEARELRFLDFFENTLTFGMQKDLDDFHVWRGSFGESRDISPRPICEGSFVNSAGVSVPSDHLSHVVVGDFDGSDQLQVLGLHADVSWYYVWKIPESSCSATYRYAPVAEGPLHNYGATPIIGDDLQHLIVTDWDADGVDEVLGFQKHNAWSIAWRASRGDLRMEYWRDFPLHDINVDEIETIMVNRQAIGGPFNSARNVPGPTELLLETSWGVAMLRGDGSLSSVVNCQGASELCAGTTFILSLDQAFRNGPVNALREATRSNSNRAAVKALIRQIARLRSTLRKKRIRLAVLVNPAHADKANLTAFLDLLARKRIPFILDVISSDVTRAHLAYDDFVAVRDPVHGLALDVSPSTNPGNENIGFYVERYGDMLEGYRIMEQLGVDQLHLTCRHWSRHEPGSERYQRTCWNYSNGGDPVTARFREALSSPYRNRAWTQTVTDLVAAASRNGQYVLWSDPHEFDPFQYYWERDMDPVLLAALEAERAAYMAFKSEVSRNHPGTVVTLYANNEGTKVNDNVPGYSGRRETPRNFRLDTWFLAPSGVPASRGWGLSNQSWTADQHVFWNDELLPPGELAIWTVDALQLGAKWIEVEPLWYFFHWPRPEQWTSLTPWQGEERCIGLPTANLVPQLRALGVARPRLSDCQ